MSKEELLSRQKELLESKEIWQEMALRIIDDAAISYINGVIDDIDEELEQIRHSLE